jgi:hypothetical protein
LLPGAAVDGKALCGSATATGARTFLVGVISHVTGVVLGQRQVPDKKGEGGHVEALLAPLDAVGMVFTLDALHTTTKTARLIAQDLDAHYVLVREISPRHSRLPTPPWQERTPTGWLAARSPRTAVMAVPNAAPFAPPQPTTLSFPGARQVFRVRRDVGGLDNVWTTKEIVYGITSLPTGLASPEHLNYYERQHWTRKPSSLDPRYDIP